MENNLLDWKYYLIIIYINLILNLILATILYYYKDQALLVII